MRINEKPGTKNRLFEMMERVNKVKLNENIYSDAQKEKSTPYGGDGQTMQTGINYADNKPVNPKLRVNAPELEKVIEDTEDNVIGQKTANMDNVRKEEILSYALDNLKKRNGSGNPSYMPSKEELKSELARIAPEHRLAFMNEKEVEKGEEEADIEIDTTNDIEDGPTDDNGSHDMPEEPKEDDNIAQLAQDKEEQGEILQGGKGDGKSPLKFDPEQVLLGLKVEKEHTDDQLVAIEIVLDHLTEDPEYYTRKDEPESSAQFGAAKDAENPEENGEENVSYGMEHGNDITTGDGMAQPHGMSSEEDEELTDELLGFKPRNVGDDMEEEFDFAGGEVEYANKTEYNDYEKYQQYNEMDFNNLTDDQKEEFFLLWQKFKDNNDTPEMNDNPEVLNGMNENEVVSKEIITEEQIKIARQALNKRGLTEGITKKEAVQLLIKHNIK